MEKIKLDNEELRAIQGGLVYVKDHGQGEKVLGHGGFDILFQPGITLITNGHVAFVS